MSNVALFITENFIKETTAIDGNVDTKYITIAIEDAQKMHILPILGTALYNEIAGQVTAGSVSANNQTLLNDYIQDALKYWVVYEGIDLFQYKITNKAVSTKTSDNSQPIPEVDVIRLMDRNKDKAEFFSERLTKYLVANITTYPLFNNPGSSYDTIHPNYDNYTTGWVLGNAPSTYGLKVDRGRNRCNNNCNE